MVERLTPLWTFEEFIPEDDGEYVRHSDYATLKSQLQAAEKRVEEWKALFDECAVARDTSGFLGTVPECIAHWEACATSREATVAEMRKALEEKMGWHPIESAPRDGSEFLVWFGEGYNEAGHGCFVAAGYGYPGAFRFYTFDDHEEEMDPRLATLWQPMPGAPTLTTKEPSDAA